MRKSFAILAVAAGLSLGLAAAPALATNFVGTYTENHNSVDPGLVLLTNNLAPSPFSFDLTNVGDTAQQNLFQIYTNEASSDWDDLQGKAITVNFAFTQPDTFGGSVGGTTDSAFTFALTGFFNLSQNNFGTVNWANNGNVNLAFGDGGVLGVHLDDANFNLQQTSLGNFALSPGIQNGATITADFTLEHLSAAVPEPATWAMMLMGFGGLGAMLRRRRQLALA